MVFNIDYLYSLQQGLKETLLLAISSLWLGLLFGVVLWLLQSRLKNKNPVMYYLFSIITNLFRTLPETFILFFIYFGGAWLVSALGKQEVEISPFLACLLTLSCVLSVYASRVFMMAFSHISQGEKDAAFVLTLSKFNTFFYIVLPKLWHHALPGIGNLWLIVLKDTALISLIGGSDLMSRTQIITRNTQQPFTYYGLLAGIYLCLTLFSESCFKKMQKQQEGKY
jgi:arginine transport system permease protein